MRIGVFLNNKTISSGGVLLVAVSDNQSSLEEVLAIPWVPPRCVTASVFTASSPCRCLTTFSCNNSSTSITLQSPKDSPVRRSSVSR